MEEDRAALYYLYTFQASAQLYFWMNIEKLKAYCRKLLSNWLFNVVKRYPCQSQGTLSHVHAIKKPECLIHRGKTLQVEHFQMHHEKCTFRRVRSQDRRGGLWLEIWLRESGCRLRLKERKRGWTRLKFSYVGDRIRLFVYIANHRRDSSIVPQGIAGFAFPPPARLIEQTTTFPAKLVGLTRNRVKRD